MACASEDANTIPHLVLGNSSNGRYIRETLHAHLNHPPAPLHPCSWGLVKALLIGAKPVQKCPLSMICTALQCGDLGPKNTVMPDAYHAMEAV